MADIAGRDALLAPSKRRFADVFLPARGVTVRIQSLMEKEFATLAEKVMKLDKAKNREEKIAQGRRIYIIACVVDGNGNRIFSDNDMIDLATWDSADVSLLQDAITSHLSLPDGDLETAVKNLEAMNEGDSP